MPDQIWLHSFLQPFDRRTDVVREVLQRAGIEATHDGTTAIAGPGVVLLPDISEGVLSFVRTMSCNGRERILCLDFSAHCPAQDAWRLLDAGGADVLSIADGSDFGPIVVGRLARWREVDAVIQDRILDARLAGKSAAWRSLLRLVIETAKYTDASVLLTGESGTGKELIAHLMHDLDPRQDKGPIVVLDCTTVVPELSGSEFFGHERGAFTGAVTQRDGAFALADRGTLFLDEIGELPPVLQAQLLRVIQEGSFKRVGGNTWYHARFRLICATHRDLKDLVGLGAFRADLYFRVAGVPIRLPSLRERVEDLLPLARYFMAEAVSGTKPPELDEAVADFLLRREYPGNVRELRQLIARLMSRWIGVGPLTLGCLPENEWRGGAKAQSAWDGDGLAIGVRRGLAAGLRLRDLGRAAEDTALRIVLEEEAGNLQRAARRLGVTDRALQLRRQAKRQAIKSHAEGAAAGEAG